MPIKVIIADDHTLLREGLKLLLESQQDMTVVGEADNGVVALEQVRAAHPDVLLLDIAMPRMTGLETISLVQQTSPQTQIVMLSCYAKEAYVHQALKAGALGYVVKGDPSSEMLKAIRTVAKGQYFISSQVHDAVISSYLGSTRESRAEHNEFSQLSDREKQVFHLLIQGNSSIEIGNILFISPKTVDKHRSSIARKIDTSNPVQMVQYAIRNGIFDPSVWEA